MITSFTSDEARREAVISRMCEEPGFDREKVENVLDLLREVVEERVSDDAPEPTPELRMAIAQRVAELSGRTVREVLEDDVSDDGGGSRRRYRGNGWPAAGGCAMGVAEYNWDGALFLMGLWVSRRPSITS